MNNIDVDYHHSSISLRARLNQIILIRNGAFDVFESTVGPGGIPDAILDRADTLDQNLGALLLLIFTEASHYSAVVQFKIYCIFVPNPPLCHCIILKQINQISYILAPCNVFWQLDFSLSNQRTHSKVGWTQLKPYSKVSQGTPLHKEKMFTLTPCLKFWGGDVFLSNHILGFELLVVIFWCDWWVLTISCWFIWYMNGVWGTFYVNSEERPFFWTDDPHCICGKGHWPSSVCHLRDRASREGITDDTRAMEHTLRGGLSCLCWLYYRLNCVPQHGAHVSPSLTGSCIYFSTRKSFSV